MKEALRCAIEDRGYTTLTPVQQAVLDPELEGRDLLVSAQTGSGKTVGFGLAIAPVLLGEAEEFDTAGTPLALVIAPTRELALQVKRELGWLYAGAGAVVTSCVGGMDMRDERRALARGAHIVVATPGRLRDHLMRESIDLADIRAVVLDEADEMLDLGFREDLEFILNEAPAARQTLLFSATVPDAIAQLAQNYQRDAARVVTRSETAQHADIEYRAHLVTERDVENAVINTLRFHEAPNAIVFANTRAMVNRLTTRLSNRGFQVVALSGELSQSERTHALQAMRDGRARVCVATDVAARGIDLPNLDLVVHAELPSNHETLLHRSGRTGRAGRKGVSALIVTGKSRRKADRILGAAKVKADWVAAPSADAVKARDEERMLADPDWHLPVEETEQATIDTLLSTFSAEQIAAGFLRLYRMSRSAPEELTDVEAKPAARRSFGPSTWFAVEGGRKAGAEPRRLLPQLCQAGDLTRDDIGAIRVQDDVTYVQLSAPKADAFVAALGADMALDTGAAVTRLAEEPVLQRPSGKGGRGPGAGKPAGKWGKKPDWKSDRTPDWKSGANPDGTPDAKRGKKPADEAAKAEQAGPRRGPQATQDMPSPRKARKTHKPDAARKASDEPRGAAPKPASKDKRARPEGKPPRKPAGASSERVAKRGGDAPPKRSDGGPSGGAGRKGGTPKGPPPPKGKPNSKKNKARALAAAKAKAAAKRGRSDGR